MKVYKDHEHGVALSPFAWRGKRFLMVRVGLYLALDPEGGSARVRTEQDFWKEAPDVFAALGQPPVLDAGLPKPGGEVLAAGFCRAPRASPVPAQEVFFRVGPVSRRIAVFGDRERLPGGDLTEPLPFDAMPLIWERAFGGPDFAANPAGKGLKEGNEPSRQVPNLEDPEHFLLSSDDRPQPVCPLPVDVANPARRALSGTYDQQWLDTRWPAYPDDCDPEFFYAAQATQRLKHPSGGEAFDTQPFFHGDEDIDIVGMHHEFPRIRSRLPGLRVRAFVTTAERFTPFAPLAGGEEKTPLPYAKDLDQPGLFQEVSLHADTVWLLPDLMGAYVLQRGLLPVVDDEMDDVLRVFVVTEKMSEAPKSLEHYFEEQKKRVRPSLEIDLAPFVAAQAATAKAVKMARDYPKLFERVKKNALGQSPVMPLSLGDMAHSMGRTIAAGRATLDALEKQMLAQREQFSHLISFDLSMFPRMRGELDRQEKVLGDTLNKAQAEIKSMGLEVKKAKASFNAKAAALLAPPPDAGPEERAAKITLAGEFRKKIEALDALDPEGLLCKPPLLNPWHDRGFPLVIAARRALRRHDALLARLAAWGFEEKTLEHAWLGYSAQTITDRPEQWGLEGPAFTLPAGLYVPRFAGRALAALRVYPLDNAEKDAPRGLGADHAAIVMAPGPDKTPLSLPAAHPGGAVLVAPEDLSALFAEQEAGDFCHVVAAGDPAELAAVKDLPPLAGVPAKESGLPLAVILPLGEEGRQLFAPWAAAFPAAIPLYLPEGCPHVLALTEHGHRLRRLLLDVLPPATAKIHDFDFPLPPKDGPPKPFALNLPLPTKEELQGRIEALIAEIRAHFPDPRQMLAEAWAGQKAAVLARLEKMNLSPELMARAKTALNKPIAPLPDKPATVAELMRNTQAALADMRTRLPAAATPELKAGYLAALDEAEQKTRALGEQLAPLDRLREEGFAKLAAFKKGEPPEDIKAAFAEKGLDPNALKQPSREEVEAELAGGKNFARRNLGGLDLSGLDFSGANLAHAICAKTNFRGCRMNGADFTFTIANEADFTGAIFREAVFMQTVLQKAMLREADFTSALLELTTLGESDCAGAVFDRAEIKLSSFENAMLEGARFDQALISLCTFGKAQAHNADFRKARAFKCLFQATELRGARFEEAMLAECLFQTAKAAGLSFAGADLRKFYADADADFSGADFSGADMREASLRMSRFCDADFYGANLHNALLAHCDLSRARLDGLNADGCRIIKCDLNRADISGAKLVNGALRKCRLTGTDVSGANLHAADTRDLVIDHETSFAGATLTRTRFAGKEGALRELARGNS
ncbi:MAG: DUF2169 domain-containing protein [Desulfovibrio sp.]|jgi:uncharacterized protein YjbI with pentapeptide repeats|nr:DUF2169 domain-containing protein [Desulfovibrio sp.]